MSDFDWRENGVRVIHPVEALARAYGLVHDREATSE